MKYSAKERPTKIGYVWNQEHNGYFCKHCGYAEISEPPHSPDCLVTLVYEILDNIEKNKAME